MQPLHSNLSLEHHFSIDLMTYKLSEISEKNNIKVLGDKNLEIHSLSSDKNARSHSIILVSSYDNIDEGKLPENLAILTDSAVYKKFNKPQRFNFLISEDIRQTFALLTAFFMKKISQPKPKLIDPNINEIWIGENVETGKNFRYGINCLIEDGSKIGRNVRLGNNVVIHSETVIGDDVTIDSGTIIGSEGFGNVFDSNKTWRHINHLGNVILKDNISIGSNCCIDRATLDSTIIGSGVIIDNLVHIAHNVTIGENTAIAAKVGIAGSCDIGKRNMIGGMVGIVDHIKTTNDVVISATSSVTKDLMEPGIYTGIMPISKHYTWKRIAFWITKLDKIVKKLNIKKI
jgi:UDP-3-O-[3-hydroxymyristoyl] glucosamine N-acyltransferase